MKTLFVYSLMFFLISICRGQEINEFIESAELALTKEKQLEVMESLDVLFNESEHARQDGRKAFDRAMQKYKEGKYQSSLNILLKAEKLSFGTCGFSWVKAKRDIAMLRFKNYFELKEYQLGRNNLELAIFYKNKHQIDSLYILSYQLEIGKELLKSKIDASLKNAVTDCGNLDCYIKIPLSNEPFTLQFKLSELESIDLFNELNDERDIKEVIQNWTEKFLNSEMYKMIKA